MEMKILFSICMLHNVCKLSVLNIYIFKNLQAFVLPDIFCCCIFSITISIPYTPLPAAVTTLVARYSPELCVL